MRDTLEKLLDKAKGEHICKSYQLYKQEVQEMIENLYVDSLLIDDNNNDIYTQCWVGVNLETYTLGKYKTKKRALQVLDDIQDLMRSLTDSDLKIIQYEMPQE